MEKIVSPKQIKSEGTQVFNVPNTPEGLEFTRLSAKYLNHSCYERLGKKGRGANRPKTIGGDLKVKDAEWFAVYAYKTREQWQKEYKRQDDIVAWRLKDVEKKIRNQIALDQIQGKAILPETMELLRKQVIIELRADIEAQRKQIIAECRAKVMAEMNKCWDTI